jgi:hypothetical protein
MNKKKRKNHEHRNWARHWELDIPGFAALHALSGMRVKYIPAPDDAEPAFSAKIGGSCTDDNGGIWYVLPAMSEEELNAWLIAQQKKDSERWRENVMRLMKEAGEIWARRKHFGRRLAKQKLKGAQHESEADSPTK